MADAAVSTTVLDEFAQPARWRAFRDPSVEASYREWHRDQIIPISRAVAAGAGLFWSLIPVSFELLVGEAPRAAQQNGRSTPHWANRSTSRRIQSHCEPGNVLISHPTWLLVRNEISCTPKGELTLKGLHRPMPAYEVQT
jgi:hypothetical protein